MKITVPNALLLLAVVLLVLLAESYCQTTVRHQPDGVVVYRDHAAVAAFLDGIVCSGNFNADFECHQAISLDRLIPDVLK